MYPKNIHRLELETIGSYSKTVIGILMITMAISLGLAIMGVWEYGEKNGVLSDVSETPFIPDNNPLETSSSEDLSTESLSSEGGILEESPPETTICPGCGTSIGEIISGSSDVSALEKGLFGPFETAAGTIEIVEEHTNLPDPAIDELPLCLTQDWLNQWSVMVAVTGGYEPLGGAMALFQPKDDECIDGVIIIEWTQVEGHGSSDCVDKWVANFILCSDPIVLESSQGPSNIGAPWYMCPPEIDLMKQVWIGVITVWTGCPDPGQHFIVMLAHKVMSQKEIPTLDKSTSPV